MQMTSDSFPRHLEDQANPMSYELVRVVQRIYLEGGQRERLAASRMLSAINEGLHVESRSSVACR